MKLCIQILLCLSITLANATEDHGLQYIATYKHIAISEMGRTGIPASIKLAQALLESGCGRSTLATKANNHFGIKCNGGWEGETYHHKDDDYENGKLIKSCFRKFGSVEDSFYEHSEFLATQRRYAFLFEFASNDYHSWANGLRKAGYATDKKYPQKLINIIEKYQLFQYDNGYTAPPLAAMHSNPDADYVDEQVIVAAADIPQTTTNTSAMKQSSRSTGSSSTRTSTSSSSKRSNRSSKSRKSSKRKSLKNIFNRKDKSNSEVVFHIVQEGQSLAEIAMIHKLDVTKMRLRNRIPKDAEPLAGEKVYLRKNISVLRRPEFTRVPNNRAVASEDEYIF